MARFWFGGDLAAWAFTPTDDAVDGDGSPVPDLVQLAGDVDFTMWDAPTGGTQYTDLRLNNEPVQSVKSSDGSDGRAVGSLPPFLGPDGVAYMWADGGAGRYLIQAWNLHDALAELATREALTQHTVERNPHQTRLADLADVTIVNPQIGQVIAFQPGGGFGLSTVPVTAPVLSVDGMTGEVVLTSIYLPRDMTLTEGELLQVLRRIVYDHVPQTNAPNLDEVYQTASGQLRLTSWRNERGMWRAESQPGSLFDNLFSAICAFDANENHGWPYQVERRNADNSRTRIGGIRWDGRISTELHPWVDLTNVDPNNTGNYAESEAVGIAPLQGRLETTDIVRLQGRIVADGITDGDTILTLPASLLPLSARLVTAPTDTGLLVPLELLVNGDVVVRGLTDPNGPHEISLDDITYARVQAGTPPAGGFTVDIVATATPGATSPLTLGHSGVAGRLYVVVMSTEGAQTSPPGTVTDNGGNTWQLVGWAPQAGGAGRRIEMWYTHATSAFTSISVPIPGGQTSFASLVEITGHDPSDPLDVADADVRSSSTTPAPLEITPSGAGKLIIAAVQANPNTPATMTPDLGWITLSGHIAGHEIVYRADAPGGNPIGVEWTFNTAAGSGHVIAAINPAP